MTSRGPASRTKGTAFLGEETYLFRCTPAPPPPPPPREPRLQWIRIHNTAVHINRIFFHTWQCCISGSGTRNPVTFWPPDPGWTSRIIFPRAWKQFFGLKILKFVDADPEYFWPWIRDGKIRIRDKHPGSETLILCKSERPLSLGHRVPPSAVRPVKRPARTGPDPRPLQTPTRAKHANRRQRWDWEL